MEDGPNWYCMGCDKFVPHSETRAGADGQLHDEAHGGCGRPVQPNRFDASQAPAAWSE